LIQSNIVSFLQGSAHILSRTFFIFHNFF
jgi:hypothetical protein